MRPCRGGRVLYAGRFERRRWFKVGEAMLVASLSALIFMVLIFAVPDCKPIHGFNATATTTTQNNRPAAGQQRHLNATAGIPGNSTDDDVIAVRDVTRETTGITNASEHVQHYEENGVHGDVFQVGDTLSSHVTGAWSGSRDSLLFS